MSKLLCVCDRFLPVQLGSFWVGGCVVRLPFGSFCVLAVPVGFLLGVVGWFGFLLVCNGIGSVPFGFFLDGWLGCLGGC